jgi:epoxide hydrolase
MVLFWSMDANRMEKHRMAPAPSLPGYGFSGPTNVRGVTVARIAEVFVSLMQNLGYPRFATQSGDWGLRITRALGRFWASRIVGIHLNMELARGVFSKEATNEEEKRWLERQAQWLWRESGYSHLHETHAGP